MEQIIVRHPDGTTALLTSRARKSGVTKAEQSITLLGADTVAITVKSATPLTFHLGDQIDVYGKTYTLNQLPGIKKTGNRNFEYTLTFEGVQYELIDVQIFVTGRYRIRQLYGRFGRLLRYSYRESYPRISG